MQTNEENVSILKDQKGHAVALKGVNVQVHLHDLIAEFQVEQSYLNPSNANIETVYTFPLPIGAVLLGLEVEIAGKKLSGRVIERKKAEHDYEDAVTDGNSAVILQETGLGLYTASIGNLMSKESAVIRYRYAVMLSWHGSKLRLLLPTTIAPRYGNAEAAGIQPHQVPTSSLLAEYPFHLEILVEGQLASATIASPSHAITFTKGLNSVVTKLSGREVMDRDFVLTIESDSAQSSCVSVPDGDTYVAVASIRIPPIQYSVNKPLAVKLLIDCSASMAGTSIIQARRAALEILNALNPRDSFNVTLFGSECRHIFTQMRPANEKFISEAWSYLENLSADMGGTEMEQALRSTFAIQGAESSPCVLLITDGEIQEHEKLVRRAAASAHRIFTVGVGTAVVDAFLEKLSSSTGGACELVSPQEGMAEKILSQFHRLRQPKLEQLHIKWPTAPEWTSPLPTVAFAGDTVHVFAGFEKPIEGQVALSTSTSSQEQTVMADISSSLDKNLPRIAAANRIKDAKESEAIALALKYQLICKWTSYLVVAEREIKANDLPELRHIPQMLPTGWGGTSLPMFSRISSSSMTFSHASVARPMALVVAYSTPRLASGFDDMDVDIPFGIDSLTVPNPPCRSSSREIKTSASSTSPKIFIERLESWVNLASPPIKIPTTLAELESLGLADDVAYRIRALIKSGYQELGIVMAFLNALADSAIGSRIERNLRRHILKRWKEVTPGALFNQEMKKCLNNISDQAWDIESVDDDLPL
jgi:Ca-activated chloride channel family protein